MALEHLDKSAIESYLVDVWQKKLGTSQHPAGKHRPWLEKGADGDPIGLYGGLTDMLAAAPILEVEKTYEIPSQVIVSSHTIDNINGLLDEAQASLTGAYASSTEVSHSTTAALTVGLEQEFSYGVPGIGGGRTQFSFEFSHEWTNGKSETTSETQTFTTVVPVRVPDGKVYRANLVAVHRTVSIPYRALIHVAGTTETWFEDRVGGHYNYVMSVGEAFRLIREYGSAGDESDSFGPDPDNPAAGIITQYGEVKASQVVDFVVRVEDVTTDYADDHVVDETAPVGGLLRPVPVEVKPKPRQRRKPRPKLKPKS